MATGTQFGDFMSDVGHLSSAILGDDDVHMETDEHLEEHLADQAGAARAAAFLSGGATPEALSMMFDSLGSVLKGFKMSKGLASQVKFALGRRLLSTLGSQQARQRQAFANNIRGTGPLILRAGRPERKTRRRRRRKQRARSKRRV